MSSERPVVDPRGQQPIPFRPARLLERQVHERVDALVGGRCAVDCPLDRGEGPEFSVRMHAETGDPSFLFAAYSMCTDCVADVRASSLGRDVERIRTTRPDPRGQQ